MSMYDNIKAAMNNTVPLADRPNRDLFDISRIENDQIKTFVEAKGEAANAANEINALKAQGQFYFRTENDIAQSTELREEMNEANCRANESVQNVNWDDLSKTDYAAALNASCGVENKKGGLDEKIQNKALLKLTLESMSKEDIVKTFDMFMSQSEQEKWLTGIANDEHYRQYIPDEKTLNAYVEETKNAMLNKEPRPDPTNAINLDFAVMDTLNEVHEKHTSELSREVEADKQQSRKNSVCSRFSRVIEALDSKSGGSNSLIPQSTDYEYK